VRNELSESTFLIRLLGATFVEEDERGIDRVGDASDSVLSIRSPSACFVVESMVDAAFASGSATRFREVQD